MIDLNTLISNALIAAVQQAVAPLNERIATLESANDILHRTQHEAMVAMRDRIAALEEKANFLEDQAVVTSNRIHDRITALETKLTEANLFTQTNNATITIDEARMVEALNSQEWFWSKINDYVERQMDDHLQTYDHDDYDSAVSKLDDMPDLDDYVTRDSVREEIEDVLNNATLSLSI